ncbi:hypothetical protein [Oscillibacter sp.]|uniref:hypothetical protein n=1 Tax=Oscillibacter sp. TaxID=1945593 RepID=UPI0028A19C01|nr:hypothetical protein [Oscillibacter sp.]
MQYESRKMFRHQRGIWLILLYFILSFAGLLLFDTPMNDDVERNREAYDHYLHQVEGKCTDETESLLSEEAQRIAKANSELQRLYGDFYDGKLTEREFNSQIAAAEETVRYQKGFELLYEQYNGIRENTENRWFLYTNGWDSLLSHDSLDLLFVLLLLLLIAPVFCQEYESKMDELILTEPKGARHHALHKIVLVVLVVCTLCLLNSGIRYLFYEWRYGLPHESYPLQSLSYFATSTREATLIGTFLKVSFGKLFGSLSFAMLILFVSVCVKKYALTLFTCTAVVLLPFYGLTLPSAKYFLPGPLGFMISTGFFRGNEYQYDAVMQEKVLTFQEIGSAARWLLWGITLCLMLMMAIIILKKHTNIWCAKNIRRVSKAPCLVLMLCILTSAFSGCSAPHTAQEHPLFNLEQSSSYENDHYRFFVESPNSNESAWMMENKSIGEKHPLVRNPMQTATKVSERIYGYGDYIYYMQIESYETGFLSTSDHFSIVEVDTRNFTDRIALEHNLDTNRDTFLGIGKSDEQDIEPFKFAEAFFLDDQNLYLIGNGQVRKVNRVTGKTDVIIEVPVLKSLSYDGESVYYINEKSELMRYDVCTGQETELYGIVTASFLLTEKEVVFINRLEQNKLYACNRFDGTLQQLTQEAVLSFSKDGSTVIYTGKADLQEHRIVLNDQ